MAEPSLKELVRKVQSLAGTAGKKKGEEARAAAFHDLVVAKMAYRTAKMIEGCPAPFTQEDADYICSIIASRVGSVGDLRFHPVTA